MGLKSDSTGHSKNWKQRIQAADLDIDKQEKEEKEYCFGNFITNDNTGLRSTGWLDEYALV